MNKLLRYALMSLLCVICGVAHADFPQTATWDFTNADVVAAAVALSGSTEAGQIKAVEDNGLLLTIEANGQTIRNNGNSIQTGNPVVFKVPVQGKKDVVTVVGYSAPYFAYSIDGVDATDATTVFTATANDVAKGYVEIVNKGQYLISISVTQNEDADQPPVNEDITGTWDFGNADVMTATLAFSGSSEAGEVEAAEKNGLKMAIEANGASFRNNGNNIQVRTGAVFKIPVRNAGDLITVKGYPGYSKYTIGNSTEELTGDNTYKAKLSDAEAGYVAVTSKDDNNYYLMLSVTQYAQKVKVTLDNEAATATFAFNLGTEGQTASFSNSDYFLNSKVTYGSNLTLKDKYTLTDAETQASVDQTRFEPAQKLDKADEASAVRFLFTPKPGFTFQPTKISLNVTRYGTDNGLVDVTWQGADNNTVIATAVKPERNNKTPNISKLSYDITNVAATEGTQTLLLHLYSLQENKQFGLNGIIIEGILNGTEKDIPILTSFKANDKEYAVEDIFGEAYEATLELSKAETMISAENPLKELTAAKGEIGTVTYEGTATTCKVTIPMTAGETQMDYILNVIQKPDFTLSYIDVDGTTVLKTQTIEKDATIGAFAYDIADVTATKDGYKARGWFKQNYLGAKFTTTDVITADTKLYAIQTEMEVASLSRKYVYDLTDQYFFDEDHEGFNSIGQGKWHDKQHGWEFKPGDKIELLVGPKATINFSLCQYSPASATIEASNGKSINAKVDNDGGAGSIDYEGEGGTLTLTLNGGAYIHNITVFNTSEPNFTKQGEWIIVKQGDASSLLDAIEMAKGIENAKIFLPNGTYDLGETMKTIISGKNISLIGQSAEKTIIVNHPPVAMEGLDKADLLKNTGEGLYMQDLSLKNDLSYGGNDGRAASLHDTGTKTICKNVFLLSHQDTYYSHKVGGLYYWEGGELHGTVDYLCGNGKVYFNEVKLVNEVRGSATITANSELYVFNNCTVENNAGTYNFGRAWSDNPVCVYLNTTLLDGGAKLAATRWNLSGLNCDYSVAGEYGTKDANGNNITPDKNEVTFTKQNTKMNTILDASALQTYSIENVLGDWAATAQRDSRQLEAPAHAKYENNTVTFDMTDNGMIACALFKNGEFVAISDNGVFNDVAIDPTKDALTIRTANIRGGFGPEGPVAGTAANVKNVQVATNANNAIYNMQGMRVQKALKGLYISNGKKIVIK